MHSTSQEEDMLLHSSSQQCQASCEQAAVCASLSPLRACALYYVYLRLLLVCVIALLNYED